MPEEKNIFIDLEKGRILFNEGDEGKEMYIVLSGAVQVFMVREGLQVILATMGPGHFFGEMSLLEQEPRSAGVIALEPTKLLVINNDNFQHFICNNPSLAIKIMKGLSGRIRASNEQISRLKGEMLKMTGQAPAIENSGDPASASGRAQKTASLQEMNRRVEENMQRAGEEDTMCPLCHNTFQARFMRRIDKSPKSRDYWLREYYDGIEPLYFKQIACPNCSFAAPGDRFLEIGQMGREYLKANETMRKGAVDLSSFAGHNYEYVLALYRLALLSYEEKEENLEVLAQTALELSWLYRDIQKWEEEREALKKALRFFKGITAKEGFQNPDLLQKSLYYQGLIHLRLKDREMAKKLFEQTLDVEGARGTLVFLFARDILETLLLDKPVKF
ncbi:MAG: DUF2225 domain-containing protein [Firmicutes bacterium]|nr:DUF2225 domain-containing protein [Bacillota bacterium]